MLHNIWLDLIYDTTLGFKLIQRNATKEVFDIPYVQITVISKHVLQIRFRLDFE